MVSAAAMECGSPYTPIYDIQSDQRLSPLLGQQLETEGVITRLMESGFWIQTPDEQQDNNQQTSEGLFISDATHPVKRLSSGQLVRLAGRVTEVHQVTQLNDIQQIITCGSAILPTPQKIQLPLTSKKSWEKYEGMRIELLGEKPNGAVAVVSGFNSRSHGDSKLVLSHQLHYQPTQVAIPGSSEAKRLHKDWLQDRLLLTGFTPKEPIRIGDQFQHLTGIVHSYAKKNQKGKVWPGLYMDGYKLIESKRPEPPVYDKQTELVVVSFNLNNYFNGKRTVYGTSFKGSRGAKSIPGFEQQSHRIEQAILALNADILVLNEIENDGYQDSSALQFLINQLNQQQDRKLMYRAVNAGYMGTDLIRSAIIYRPHKVTGVGEASVLNKSTSSVDGQGKALFDDYGNRPVIIQKFRYQHVSLAIAAVHLKSKGSSCKETKKQRNFGGRCNMKRSRAAMAIVEKMLDFRDTDIQLVLGDFNAYKLEQPLRIFYRQGWENAADLSASEQYSYRFRGRLGSLDHILYQINSQSIHGFKPQRFFSWNINSTEGKQTGLVPYLRSSDHDPQVLTLGF